MLKLSCPFRLLTSHTRNERGFAALQGHLIAECRTEAIHCLGIAFTRFAVRGAPAGHYLLEAASPELNTQNVLDFLDRLEVALTAHFGANERNAYYGTPYIEFDRFNLELTPDAQPSAADGTVAVTVVPRLSVAVTGDFDLSPDAVPGLACNPLLQLYADGLRASSAESKFFHWFIILEEFLEKKSDKLDIQFKSLFSDEDKAAVRTLANTLSDGRKKAGLVNALAQTVEPRHEKLAAILQHLGIASVEAPGCTLAITADVCQNLIRQRNQLFHRGAHIAEGPLYNALFPIVTELARRSEEIIALR
jgi:hypothetical protein